MVMISILSSALLVLLISFEAASLGSEGNFAPGADQLVRNRSKEAMEMTNLTPIILFLGFTAATTAHAQQKNECANKLVVELKLNNVWSQNVPNGAFVHDSVYVGVGEQDDEALENAVNSCKEGKFSEEKCRSATQTTFPATDPKYSEITKALTGCS